MTIKTNNNMKNLIKRGRPAKSKDVIEDFDPSSVKIIYNNSLNFSNSLFEPLKTNSELDVILSTDGGIMPAVNMVLVGGPGTGKTTVALDMVSKLINQGYKCLFVSAEMDEIGYYKYCKRLPQFNNIPVLFAKNYAQNIKSAIEHTFDQGWDVVVVDSLAEVVGMYKEQYKTTEYFAERWLLGLEDRVKKGQNQGSYYTSFINVQQVTKGDDFVGSNRIKHMTDSMAHIERSRDRLQRTIYFSKNRDCDKDFKMYFSFYQDKVYYTFEEEDKQ
jgi:predicted ATP-dependent serine protease